MLQLPLPLVRFVSGLNLSPTKRTDPRLLQCMAIHYSQPKGFVGRNICYAIEYDGDYYGHIVGGSCTLHLPGRNEFFDSAPLNNICNNIFFHLTKPEGQKYPRRNFAELVLSEYRKVVERDWLSKYGDILVGHETLVEPPRTGECYLRDDWTYCGTTKGIQLKRVSGDSTEKYGGKRVWNTDPNQLRPKLVFVKKS